MLKPVVLRFLKILTSINNVFFVKMIVTVVSKPMQVPKVHLWAGAAGLKVMKEFHYH